MGISMGMIETLQGLGLFGKGRISVLDVGSSNLYSASAEGVQRFLASYGVAASTATTEFAERLARGSAYDPVSGGLNGAFVGELLEKAGLTYHAIDIADGYGTTILDLNHESAPPQFVGAFDLVLNFGTTEHLLNQYNAFKVIHDSTKVGGYMVHSIPSVGFSNHGYLTYTPRCMFDLAGYNEYEVVGFWFEGPCGNSDLFAPVRDYSSYFPSLAKTLADREVTEAARRVAELQVPDVALMIVYRKVKGRPFAGALERSTSVGIVPGSVTSAYESVVGKLMSRTSDGVRRPLDSWFRRVAHWLQAIVSGRKVKEASKNPVGSVSRHDELALTGRALELRDSFVSGSLTYDECLAFYNLVVQQAGSFPFDWEYVILLKGIEREPERSDLLDRLKIVRSHLHL